MFNKTKQAIRYRVTLQHRNNIKTFCVFFSVTLLRILFSLA